MAEEDILLSLDLLLCAVIIKLKQKRHRRYKVRPINRERRKLGLY
jgi:hypothetical protein